MAIYLSTYRPLAGSSNGREAVRLHRLPPFVDDSTRREPDFQSSYPSISAICHGRMFAPRLHVGDLAVYLTKKGRYAGGGSDPDHRLVAILEVVERFESHEAAARWYADKGLPLPSNCMVPGNPPLPPSYAVHRRRHRKSSHEEGCDGTCNTRSGRCNRRDAWYRERAQQWGTFLACHAIFLDLLAPPSVSDDLLTRIFGGIPGTRTPKAITQVHFEALVQGCGVLSHD